MKNHNTHTTYRASKVALLGPSHSGKSSLAYALADQIMDEPIAPSVEGINCVPLHPQTVVQGDITEIRQIILWDFIGSDSYRVIHEAFLEDLDIALITWTYGIPYQDEVINYWLDVIRKLEVQQKRDIPIYIVITKTDAMRSQRLDQLTANLRKSFEKVDHVFVTSQVEKVGIDALYDGLYGTVPWDLLSPAVPTHVLEELEQCINLIVTRTDEIVKRKSDLHRLLLETNEFSVSTMLYNQLLDQLQIKGLIFQFPTKERILLQPDILEPYIIEIFKIPREDRNGALAVIDAQEMLRRPLFNAIESSLAISSEQELELNGLILHYIIHKEWALLINGSLIFLSNIPEADKGDWERYDGALIVELPHVNSLYFPQLIVQFYRTQDFDSTEYLNNAVRFIKGTATYSIMQRFLPDDSREIWLYCNSAVSDFDRLVFENYVNMLLLELNQLTTAPKRRHYNCSNTDCGVPFDPDEIKPDANVIQCIVCEEETNISEKVLTFEEDLELYAEINHLKAVEDESYQTMLSDFKIELSKVLQSFDYLLIFDRTESDTILNYVSQPLRAQGFNPYLIPINAELDPNEYDIISNLSKTYRVVYFVSSSHQIQAQIPYLDILYQHLTTQHDFTTVVIQPNIIGRSHDLIKANKIMSWSPESSTSTQQLLEEINFRDYLQTIEDVEAKLGKYDLMRFPEFGESIVWMLQVSDLSLLSYDQMSDPARELYDEQQWVDGQFWIANLALRKFGMKRTTTLFYVRRGIQDNEQALLQKLATEYKPEFTVVVDVNGQIPEIRLNVGKFVYLDMYSLRNLIRSSDRTSWLARYFVRYLNTQLTIEQLLPFNPRRIATNNIFFGRESELDYFKILDRHNHMEGGFVLGAKRSGKTSFLRRINNMLTDNDHYQPIAINAGALPVTAFMQRCLRLLKIPIPPNLTPEVWIQVLHEYRQQNNVIPVLLLDEMDKLIDADREIGFQLSQTIYQLRQDKSCLIFIAGHTTLREEMKARNCRLYYESVNVLYLKGIEKSAAERLLTQLLGSVGFELTSDQMERIYVGTGGIPYLMIHFCINLLVKINEADSKLDRHSRQNATQSRFYGKMIRDEEVNQIETNDEFLAEVYHYYQYDHHAYLEHILFIISQTQVSTRQSVINYFIGFNVANAVAICDHVLTSLIDTYEIVQEDVYDKTLSLSPSYLQYAIDKKIGKFKTLDEVIEDLLVETPSYATSKDH